MDPLYIKPNKPVTTQEQTQVQPPAEKQPAETLSTTQVPEGWTGTEWDAYQNSNMWD